VNRAGTEASLRAANLRLDELEVGSLRGELQEATVEVDLGARAGKAALAVEGPRYSGLRARSFQSAFRRVACLCCVRTAAAPRAARRPRLSRAAHAQPTTRNPPTTHKP
jgi:hypothetical protein